MLKRNRFAVILIMGITLLTCMGIYSVLHERFTMPQNYEFSKLKSSHGIMLFSLKTLPDNVTLKVIHSNVTKSKLYGINGGFFYNEDLLSIAVMNDQPIKGKQDDYGSGWQNVDRKRGTLVWDQAAKRFSVQVVETARELIVTDRNRYWAQGGVSMNLSDERGLDERLIEEEMPASDEERMRSGMVYDASGQLWLIVTPTPCTALQFRNAIQEKITKDILVDGIFLDGDGSSQFASRFAKLSGDKSEVCQMIALLK